MSVDADTVRRIGRLARIRITEEEVAAFEGEINAILGFVEQLGEVDVEGVEPMTSVMPMQLRRRDDVVTDGGYAEKIVANAPISEDHYYMGPKAVDEAPRSRPPRVPLTQQRIFRRPYRRRWFKEGAQ